MTRALTEIQARRLRKRIAGFTLSEIGAQEGVAKEAVFKSIAAAHRKLTGEDIGTMPTEDVRRRMGGAAHGD